MYTLYYICIPFTSPTNILACYPVRRSRCENRKLAFRKRKKKNPNKPNQKNQHTLPLKHKRKTHTETTLKSKPAPFQVFYTSRSIIGTLQFWQLYLHKSDYIQYSEKDTVSYLMQWIFKRHYLSHHTCASREYFSSKFTEKLVQVKQTAPTPSSQNHR